MGRVADAGRHVGRIGMGRHRDLEEAPRLVQHALPEQGPPDLEQQVVVVPEAEREDAIEASDRAGPLAELEERLTKARERVLVIGVERHGFLEGLARPGVFFARQPRVAHPHVQLDYMGIERQPLTEDVDGLVVLCFVVELMRAFVVVVGAEERFRHRTGLPGRLCYDTTPRAVSQATAARYRSEERRVGKECRSRWSPYH